VTVYTIFVVQKFYTMKLIIFGASGGTGKQVVQQALEQGHSVTAFVRNPKKITLTNPNLQVVKGDVLDAADLRKYIAGHDAVICCLGAPANKAYTLRSEGTKNIVNAMKDAGVARFICQTSLGFGDSKIILRNTPFVFKKIIVPFFLATTFAEHEIQEKIIKASGLDYTIVRPGSLTNAAFTGQYQTGFTYTDTSIKVKIARADVAHCLLRQLTDSRYHYATTGISY
jgi:putative NADH-flavin reductase